jgi:N utilization substance protein B
VADPNIRRRARERALQFLFGIQITGYDWRQALEPFWAANPTKQAAQRYADRLIEGVCTHLTDLDTEIHEALERWAPERVGHVERAALRIALYEMRYVPDVPAGVAINEALEVVRRFGSVEAPRFVNGVLDRLARNVRSESSG